MHISVEADNVVVVHLSDIHIAAHTDPIMNRTEQIARSLNSISNEFSKKVIILWSGDIAQSGVSEEYRLAESFYTDLFLKLSDQGYEVIGNIAVPGNHDVKMGDDSRLDSADKINDQEISASRIKSCVDAQKDYFDFIRNVLEIQLTDQELLYYNTTLKFNNSDVIFHCFNSSWLSRRGGEIGKLAILTDNLNVDMSSYNYSISVIHHPYSWLNPHWNKKKTRSFIDKLSNLVMTGHEHDPYISRTSFEDTEADFLEAAALQERGHPRNSGFSILHLRMSINKLDIYRCFWDDNHYNVKKPDSIDIKRRNISNGIDFTYNNEFVKNILATPPGLSNSPLPISLTDIIEIPDFISQNTDSRGQRITVRAKNIMQHLISSKKCFLLGDSKSGKTAFLYELMEFLHKKRIVPLYLDSNDQLRDINKNNFDKVIESSLKTQYSDKALSPFTQLNKDERAVVIDNVDILDSSSLRNLLKFLEERFSYIYMTSRPEGEIFYLETVQDNEYEYEKLDFSPLNRQQRRRMINRLAYYFLSESNLALREKKLSVVEEDVARLLNYNNLPSWPIYVILVSKSFLDSDYNIGDTASYSHLYEVLINNNVAKVYKDIEEFSKTKKFIGYLAFHMHTMNTVHINLKDIEKIAQFYEDLYDTTINLKFMLGNLIQAGIFNKNDDVYFFSYPAFFYYFVAQYITLLDRDMRHLEIDKVISGIKNIYNTEMVLFLAYLYTEDYIMNKLCDSLKDAFKDYPILDFKKDLGGLDRHIREMSEIVYTQSSVEENKEEIRESLDRSEENARQSWKNYEKKKDEFQDDYTLSFKIIEILGQIIRSKSGVLQGDKKADVITTSFNVILRSGSSIISVVEYLLEDALPKKVEVMMKEGKLESVSKAEVISKVSQALTMTTQIVVYSMIRVISRSLGYENLRKTFDRVETNNDSQAYKFFLLGARLNSSAGDYPFERVDELFKDTEGIIFTRSILQWMVYTHILYNIMSTKHIQRALSDVGMKYEPNIHAKLLA